MQNPKYTLFQSVKDNQFYFNLKAGNGEIILQSEGYVAKDGAENGIESVKTHSPKDKYYERKASRNNRPYFVLKASNGEPIGHSEMYEKEAGRDNGIDSVKTNGPGSPTLDLA